MSSLGNIDDLIERFAERVAEKVKALLTADNILSAPRRRLLSIEEAAIYLGRSEEAVRHLINSGKLPAVRIDKRVFIDVEDLDALIRAHKQGAGYLSSHLRM